MSTTTLRRLAAASLWSLCAATLLGQSKQLPVKQSALLKLAEPWPDAETLHARRIESEKRPLFAGTEAFPLTLSADFKVINKDRSVEGKKDYPGVLTAPGPDGKKVTLHVKLRTRGHFRLRASSCSFVPLRIEFDRDEAHGSIFDGQKTLKLITHCRNDSEYEQYTLREYLVYRMQNILTSRSFRARLTTATYETPGGSSVTKLGMFLEDDDDVARRMEGRIMALPRLLFKDVDRAWLTNTMIFEYMVGNTDFSMYALHNVVFVKTPDNIVYTVPYDWDLSGLVETAYAIPDKTLGIRSVKDRLYRGPCRRQEEVDLALQLFRAHKAELLALYDTTPQLTNDYKRSAKDYLESFFRGIDRPGDVKRTFVEGGCSTKTTM
jgi:hypothetical protein